MLRAYRLCVSSIWRTIASYAGADDIGVRIAIEAADTTMAYLERVSSELTQSYLRASSVAWADSPALRTDVLETLLTGEPINEYARRQAAVLATSIRAPLLVVVLRVSEPDDPLTGVREALRTVRSQLSPQSGSFLFGARDTEVICICTLNHDDNGVHIEGIAHELAASGRGWAVGIGRISDGVSGIRRSYGEAREAVELSLSLRQPSRALRFADLLLDQILSSTRYTDALLEETVRPLVEYDRHKNADLLPTLRAYMRAGFNLTKAAAELTVNPNTVAYRLRRIHTLTRHDPSTVDDLLLLALGLKLYDNTQSL
ncbi:helix-turn-helix domain-containing protein [Nocardia vinacea]|uniref:Helix-turn-helix domain-containing protein n=1 Tax=Nocardia vinacea TaxID=96468 RepID=A0ABZ1YS99_9NOCA|nr:helix-turn-helix domain-containing protein [Nocardia vinacea]